MNVVHVTHEAVEKMGGIGAVIAGLVTSEAYAEQVSRTVLLGPLLKTDSPANRRLGPGGKVLYSSLDEFTPGEWREKFRPIELAYDVGIIYGTRVVDEPCTAKEVTVETLVVDVFHANHNRLNLFKAEIFKKFAIPSVDFENIWEYEQYVRLAEPGFEALKAIGLVNGDPLVLLAHEYMGMPTVLKAVLDGSPNTRTVFYAHEVATVRPIVEKRPGHDTMFYNILRKAQAADASGEISVEKLFPEVASNFKHPLVRAARYCDCVFAVGDFVRSELEFLEPHFGTMEIDLVYNGIPSSPVTFEEKQAGRDRMADYAENLLGRRPTWIFTHVARPVLSKGIWRDLGVCHELDPILARRGQTAVYFMLGTLGGQRRSRDILHMESVYGWPVVHEEGYPDLCGGEEVVASVCDNFNRHHDAIRAVLVNQWGWNRRVCGQRMPEEMTFADIRLGTDVEFGLSVYEPFGISQLEPLSAGALCVVSNVCGCLGFARRAGGAAALDANIIEADFLHLPGDMSIEELLSMSIPQREKVEQAETRRLAKVVRDRLPKDESAVRSLMESGMKLAEQMSWDRVVNEYFLPSLSSAAS